MKRKVFTIILWSTIIYIITLNILTLCRNYEDNKVLKSLKTIDISVEEVDEYKEKINKIITKGNKMYLDRNSELILDSIEKIIDLTEDYKWGIDNIKEIIYGSNAPTSKGNLPYLDKLRTYYLVENNYAEVAYLSVESLLLAEEVGNEVIKAKALIEMAILFEKIGGSENAIEILKSVLNININDSLENADIKVYSIINLAEIYLSLDDYKNAEEVIKKIDSFKECFNEEDYIDIEMLRLAMEAEIDIYKGNLEEAKLKLDKYIKFKDIDKFEYYIRKDISYSIVLAKLYQAEGRIEQTKEIYLQLLNYAREVDDVYLCEKLLDELIIIEEEVSKKSMYREKLLTLLKSEQLRRYNDYSINILDNITYKSALIESYNSKLFLYRILVITIILVIVLGILHIKRIRHMKYINGQDLLTSSLNRRRFDEEFSKVLKKETVFSIIMMDIDNFKKINDTYGHKFGDLVLIKVCKVIINILEKEDKLYRFGGEEFIIICQSKGGEEAFILAEKIRKAVEDIKWQEKIVITLSLGISCSNNNLNDMVETADKKLYISKNTGKNKVTI